MEMNLLQAVINTLNSIEVHGKDNLSKLLGCINLLESVLTEPDEQKEEGE